MAFGAVTFNVLYIVVVGASTSTLSRGNIYRDMTGAAIVGMHFECVAQCDQQVDKSQMYHGGDETHGDWGRVMQAIDAYVLEQVSN
ncbi:hypothetical protein PGT21_019571 [Puccinia graminis f. sp. tritici]|nr:hypothetical protein PGT21_019571 [Puccinia graminis f. sp. tritici]